MERRRPSLIQLSRIQTLNGLKEKIFKIIQDVIKKYMRLSKKHLNGISESIFNHIKYLIIRKEESEPFLKDEEITVIRSGIFHYIASGYNTKKRISRSLKTIFKNLDNISYAIHTNLGKLST